MAGSKALLEETCYKSCNLSFIQTLYDAFRTRSCGVMQRGVVWYGVTWHEVAWGGMSWLSCCVACCGVVWGYTIYIALQQQQQNPTQGHKQIRKTNKVIGFLRVISPLALSVLRVNSFNDKLFLPIIIYNFRGTY